ncbi:EF-hand calcium-binding domain-containing protein 4B-like isoform X2 [Ptychodera flava]|uniref:EF-hand calcium-binding domain-containing protein 4B-like isoform X2 n=1 Tax=Ptychodera flava TaxID=63121 RepID=UPI003969C13B
MTTEYEGVGQTPSVGEMKDMLAEKATELFMLCDKEEKGFITKRDMQRLGGELPLTPDQLEAVFDSLDDDGNGYLTLEEFTDGFGGFLGFGSQEPTATDGDKDVYEVEQGEEETQEDDPAFQVAMESLGANDLFDDSGRGKRGRLQHFDQQHIKDLWKKLKKDEPDLLGDFEDFIQKVSSDIRKARIDSDELENALKHKSYTHDEEVRKLYEEMENQIKAERERILNEEKEKERKVREEMAQEILQKDQKLHELLQKQADLEKKIEHMTVNQQEITTENDMLAKVNFELEDKLKDTDLSLQESKQYLKELQEKSMREKRERAHASLRVTEGISRERESLVRQLDILREMNKKLRDEKDMHEAARQKISSLQDELTEATKGESESPRKGRMNRQGSIMSNYFSPSPPKRKALQKSAQGEEDVEEEEVDGEGEGEGDKDYDNGELAAEDDIEVDDDDYYIQKMKENGLNGVLEPELYSSRIDELHVGQSEGARGASSGSMASLGRSESVKKKQFLRNGSATVVSGDSEDSTLSSSSTSPASPRAEPVGCQDTSSISHEVLGPLPKTPERVYKVVFVGDSGVGKSSFIYRFCKDSFKSNFSATIGVDFQVKNVIVDRKMIALQLWDTAGQERFRSITKQYFRKADGVLVVYDISSESSFTNVRNWMTSVSEGVEEGTVTMILGNKVDIEEQRQVKQKDGHKLAEEYESLFYEASAKSGYSVDECIQALARKLQEREDREIEKVLTLGADIEKKKGCCPIGD